MIAAEIYGFGKWQNERFTFQEQSPIIINGANETGKSTLRRFFMFVLFGSPPKEREFFQPKRGGEIGGNLEICVPEIGILWIERTHRKRNGEAICRLENGEERGEDFLKHALGGMTRQVFQSIYAFDTDDLAYFYDSKSGTLGEALMNVAMVGSDHIQSAEQWLKERQAELFKPNGKKPTINHQIEKLTSQAKDISNLEAREQEYGKLIEQKQQTEARLARAKEELDAYNYAYRELEQLSQVLQLIEAYHSNSTHRDEGGRLHSLDFPENGLERFRQLNEAILPMESEYRVLKERVDQYTSDKQRLEEEAADSETVQTAQALCQKGEEWKQLNQKMENLSHQINERSRTLKADLTHLSINLHVDDLEDYTFPYYLESQWEELIQSRQKLQQEADESTANLNQVKRQIEYYQTYVNQLDHRTYNDHSPSSASSDWLNRASHKLVGAILGLTGAGFLTSWLFEGGMGTDVVLVILILMLSVISTYLILSQKPKNTEQGDAVQWSVQHTTDHVRQLNLDKIRLEEQAHQLEHQLAGLSSHIETHESYYPFLSDIPLEKWVTLYPSLKHAKNLSLYIQDLKQQSMEMEATASSYEQEIKTFLLKNNRVLKNESVQHCLEKLKTWVARQEQIEEERVHLTALIGKEKQKVDELSQRIHPYKEKINMLMHQVGAETEEDYYQAAAQAESEQDRLDKLQSLSEQIRGALPASTLERFNVFEQPIDPIDLQERMNEMERAITACEESLEGLRQQQADMKSSIKDMEQSEKLGSLKHAFAADQDRLNKQAREWAVYQVADQLIKKAKRVYQDEYVPDIVNAAEEIFTRLTAGNYNKIIIDANSEMLQVRNQDNQLFQPAELSRGTTDQLYVALRIALGITMMKVNPFPFFVDDAFVHFDSNRQAVMMKVMTELADHHQVMIFTTRTKTANHFPNRQNIALQ
nr:AAA family ATPase [Thalassobacillus sp. CUG 92003]